MVRRSTSWQWRRRRWVSWLTKPLFCGLQRDRLSGKPSGRFSSLVAWKVGRVGIKTCWSSLCRAAFRRRRGSRGSGARTTTAASYATKPRAQCSTAATSAQPCARRGTCVSRRRCARRHFLWSRYTGNNLRTALSRPRPPCCQQVLSNGHAQFCGTTDPQTGS